MPEKEKVRIGLVAAPELAAEIANDIADELPDTFFARIDDKVSWEIDKLVDPLTGAAEDVDEILKELVKLKKDKGWAYAICLTDLPIFFDREIVAADTDVGDGVAQISLPAFGWLPMRKRLKKSVIQIMHELYNRTNAKGHDTILNKNQKNTEKNKTNLLKKQFPITPVRRVEPSADNSSGIDVRFIVFPRFNGQFRLLLGMTHANRPTSIMSSFKKIIAIAFTTGAFGLIFTTMWKLSIILPWYRLLLLMFAAIGGMVVWIIAAHELWENKSVRNKKGLRRLYNRTTAATLTISVIIYYSALFLIFLMAVFVLIPPDMLKEKAGMENHPGILTYMRLAWLSTSISTIVGAIGAGLENEELVRNITYGYRQKRRYQEIEKEKN